MIDIAIIVLVALLSLVAVFLAGTAFEAESDRVSIVAGVIGILLFIGYTYLLL